MNNNKNLQLNITAPLEMISAAETEIVGVTDELRHLLAGDDAVHILKLEKSRMLKLLEIITNDCNIIRNNTRILRGKEDENVRTSNAGVIKSAY